jgi:TPR repeat protein
MVVDQPSSVGALYVADLAQVERSERIWAIVRECLTSTSARHRLTMRKIQLVADHGDPEAQCCLAILYDRENDRSNAMMWCKKAAYAGVEEAMLMVGSFLENGYKGARDLTSAAVWFWKAADIGCTGAFSSLKNLNRRIYWWSDSYGVYDLDEDFP